MSDNKIMNKIQDIVIDKLTSSPSVIKVPEVTTPKINVNRTSKYIHIIRLVVTGAALAWLIYLIVNRFTSDDEENKRDLEVINGYIFGGIGILPTLLCLWVLTILILAILPQLNKILEIPSNLSGITIGLLKQLIGL